MPKSIESTTAVVVLVVVSFLFQLQLKIFAGHIVLMLSDAQNASRLEVLARAAIGWRPLAIAILAVAAFAVWLFILTRLELSVALPVASIALVVNSVGAGLLLGENLSSLRIGGIVVVAAGIAMVLRG